MSDKKKRILVITDSLGLPRHIPENCSLEQSWPRLLAEKYDVIQISLGGGTVAELYRQVSGYYISAKPDIVIIQAGIVDCAPRAFSKKELDILSYNKLGRLFLRVVKPYSIKLRKFRNRKYTKPALYKGYISKFGELFDCPLFWIATISGNELYEKKVPGITKSVQQYNEFLMEHSNNTFKLIPTDDFDESDVMSDNIHLTHKGCSKLFAKICAALD